MKKGFTLIELLAVVIIIGIILMVTVPPVFNVVNQTKTEAYNKMIGNIENAAQLYVTNNRDGIANINVVGSDIQITIQTLVDYGIIKLPIKDPKYGNTISPTTIIDIKVVKKNAFKIRMLYNKDDTTAPTISIIGPALININQNDVYTDAGATAIDDYDGDLTNVITVNSNVMTNIPGTYSVVYSVYDSAGNLGTKTRTIIVHDTESPTVTFSMNGNSTYAKTRNIIVTVNDNGIVDASSLKYQWTISNSTPTEASFSTSFTNGSSVSTPAGVTGNYYLWVLAKDAASNTVIKGSNVFNLDNIAPVITMTGTSPVTIDAGTVYTDAGATATDNIDSSVTVTSNSNVNVNAAGTYSVIYNANDISGNAATPVTRTVIVMPLSTVDVLVVAGGGGGGWDCGGGGGAGGIIYRTGFAIPSGSYTITVGNGGSGATSGAWASNGGNSVFYTLTAVGGGYGGINGGAGNNGGSGGGAGYVSGLTGGTATSGQGYNGGAGKGVAYRGAGGGGAGGAGSDANVTGNGGPGIANSISGASVYYGGGGGAGELYQSATSGGIGGGGAGGAAGTAGISGTANTGGGGGSGANSANGGYGGSGIIIIRYAGAQKASGGSITSSGGYTIHTFYSSGTFTVW